VSGSRALPDIAPGIGRHEPLRRGSIASVAVFRHAGDHRDPAEERFVAPSILFTAAGAWGFRSSTVAGTADAGHALLAGAGVDYACRHDERRPVDRTLDVTFDPAIRLDRSFVDVATLVPVTPELHGARTRLLAAALAVDEVAGLRFDLAAADLVRTVFATGIGERAGRVDFEADVVDAALAHIRANLADDLDLATLASAAALSPFHFARLFRRRVGEPPVRHVRRLRLERAAQLLRETNGTVTEIALDAGFGSLSNFVTLFRGAFGLSPDRWRRTRSARSGKTVAEAKVTIATCDTPRSFAAATSPSSGSEPPSASSATG
jgi:AraC-like DNA-binding protein